MKPPDCGRIFDDAECIETGDHFCWPRAQHAVAFIEEICVHTKGAYSGKAFTLEDWQREDIVEPLFGATVWSPERGEYKRQYEIAWIELGRKNGKSELLAAFMLYLLLGDGEESAELYGIARDRDQAGLVFDVTKRMTELSPVLRKRLKVTAHVKRIFDPKSASFYQVLASDAAGALGSNPSGVAADEILAHKDDGMWTSLRTGMGSGARKQPLMLAATTAGNDSESFGGKMHAEMLKVDDDPGRAPHIFTYIRNTPKDADPWDEKNWYFANPALGEFLSIEGMRKQALEAQNDPALENAFRQYRLNQWVNQAFRWMPMHLYDAAAGEVWPTPEFGRAELAGRECWVGLDLAATQDLTAWCLLFPDGDGGADVLWRFWLPEGAVERLDRLHSGAIRRWAEQGWLTVTSGDVLDYQQVYADVEADAERFTILGVDADAWSAAPVIQEIEARTSIEEIYAYKNDYTHMSPGMRTIMDLVKERKFRHHGNPVARWCFDSVEARVAPYDPDIIRPDKPNRGIDAKRIDGVPTAIMAVNAWTTRGSAVEDEYEYDGFAVY